MANKIIDNSDIKNIKKELESKAQQISYRDSLDNTKTDINVDSDFARCIDEFMTGKSTLMPTRDKIEKLCKNTKYYIISMGYGYTISKDLTISHIEPITNKIDRIDVISPDKYYAFSASQDKHGKEININKNPLFDKDKVELLQKYLCEIIDKEYNEVRVR